MRFGERRRRWMDVQGGTGMDWRRTAARSLPLLLELFSRAKTGYPLTLSKTGSVTVDSSRDCRRYVLSPA